MPGPRLSGAVLKGRERGESEVGSEVGMNWELFLMILNFLTFLN